MCLSEERLVELSTSARVNTSAIAKEASRIADVCDLDQFQSLIRFDILLQMELQLIFVSDQGLRDDLRKAIMTFLPMKSQISIVAIFSYAS